MVFESTVQMILAYVIQFIFYFAIAWVAVAAVQLVTNRFALPKKMPLRGILIAAAILTLLSALRGGPRFGGEFVTWSDQPTIVMSALTMPQASELPTVDPSNM